MSTVFRRGACAAAVLLLCAGTLTFFVARSSQPSASRHPLLTAQRGGDPDGGNEADNLAKIGAARATIAAAPGRRVAPGAYARGARAAARMAARPRTLAEDGNAWTPYGIGPLHSDDADYAGVNGEGLSDLSGRPTDFAYDQANNRLYASVAYGGVWESDDQAKSWHSVGDSLPTQVVGSVGYSPAEGGTLIAITGDGSFGADSLEGMGAFRSTDDGKTWQHADGVPSSAFGFRVAVDKAHPSTVYVATGAGLFRSTDDGRTFSNVNLPVGGGCTGAGNRTPKCLYANIVTDVVVQAPGGSGDAKGGAVLAAVGWRGGDMKNPDGTVQSPGNGLYASDTGAPGSFKPVDGSGLPSHSNIGRIALGPAVGADQDHGYVYAMIQDAVLLRHGVTGLDDFDNNVPLDQRKKIPTAFNGVYVSSDFGQTWREMTNAEALQSPTTGSALGALFQATGAYGPGVQSWYNLWISPDPSRQLGGVPTQVLFGLEEVWRNEETHTPQAGPSSFRVVGRYFSGDTCQGLSEPGVPCPTNREDAAAPTTTTHPDQHAAIWIPQKDGSSKLVVGNDGGVYVQDVSAQGDVTNDGWGKGAQGTGDGALHTLLPYDAAMAKDGTVWMGLQDNGTAKITDIKNKDGVVTESQRQIMALGGDGFFVGVDPNNSDKAYGEYTYGAMSATKDGGKTWTGMNPPITDGQFSNPFAVDPHDADHVMTAGRQVVETGSGGGTSADDWAKVFDLGTQQHRGDANATPSATDPVNSMTAIDLNGPAAYVGFCGVCDVLNSPAKFKNGIATNVGGDKAPQRYSGDGWHFAAAAGLPNRYITSINMDPSDPKTVWVTLGGYERPWTPPGFAGPASDGAGGHLYLSRDAGEHFTDMTGNLPDVIANDVVIRDGMPIVATDVGAFRMTDMGSFTADAPATFPANTRGSSKCKTAKKQTHKKKKHKAKRKHKKHKAKAAKKHKHKAKKHKKKKTTAKGCAKAKKHKKAKHKKHKAKGKHHKAHSAGFVPPHFEVLGTGLPAVRVMSLQASPGDPNLLVAATYGRGVYTYRLAAPAPPTEAPPAAGPPPAPFGNTTVASFDFETDDQGWTHTSNSQTMDWARRPPGDGSSSSFQVIPYTDKGTASLKSPVMTLPQASTVQVTWTNARNTEDGFDYLSVEWSSDGHVWHSAAAVTGMNDGFPNFSAEHSQFAAPAGKLQIRFRLTSDDLVSSPAYQGVAIDNVAIKR